MTQRVSAIMLTFNHPIREDDVEHMLMFLSQIKGVRDVRLVETDTMAEYVAEARRDAEWREKLNELQSQMMNEGR